MTELSLREFHRQFNAAFATIGGCEVVAHYGDVSAEHTALHTAAGVVDLTFRSRLCLTGTDRAAFLHGQVTNSIRDLRVGQGCYAALVTAKGRLQSDLNVYCLADELLLDFEPGLSAKVAERFEKFIIAEDVQVVDVAPHYGLLSVQGPRAAEVVEQVGFGMVLPDKALGFSKASDATIGDVYCMQQSRIGGTGFDLFVPSPSLATVADKLVGAAGTLGGRACGWEALELARVEAGIPRFGADMDETNIAPEAGIESRAISYSKGCYIGQEVIARLRTYGQVARALRGLVLEGSGGTLPARGAKLFLGDKEVGVITSAIVSPRYQRRLALAYVRRECNEAGTCLQVRDGALLDNATVTALPFRF